MSVVETTLFTVLVVFIAGVLRGFSGFGAGLVLVPTLSLLFNPIEAVITVVLLEMIPSFQLVPSAISRCHWRSVIPMVLCGVLTVPLGSLLLVKTDADTMRIVIATLVLTGVVILASGWRFAGSQNYKGPALTGMVSGLFSGAAGLGGLPVIMFYLSSGHSSNNARASIVVFLFITVLVSLLTYLLHGIVSVDILMRTVYLSPIFILAIWVGGKLFGKVSDNVFRAFTLSLLGCVGLMMILSTP